MREFSAECQGDASCIANGAFKFIDDLSKDLAKILRALRKEAPDADIIVIGSWDSFIDALEFVDPLFQLLNLSMAAAADTEQARFVNPFPLFNPQGDLHYEAETLCAMLLLCTPQPDSHPSDLGYQVLGDLVWNVSGYGPPVPKTVPTRTSKPRRFAQYSGEDEFTKAVAWSSRHARSRKCRHFVYLQGAVRWPRG